MKSVNFAKHNEAVDIINSFKNSGFAIIELDTPNYTDTQALYKILTSVIPMGIPLSGKINWDSFLDSAWEGITEKGLRDIVLVWKNSQTMLRNSLSDFFLALTILQELSSTLASENPQSRFIVLALGEDENYQ